MKPYDRVTIIRNRLRARDLRIFRARVQDYFEQLESEAENLPVDWNQVRATRAEINRMLPRVVQIVEAADLGGPAPRAVETLHHIFSDRYNEGAYQEVLDVVDMAVGVYHANRYAALVRTVNPFHYVAAALGFLAGLPRRGLVAFGLLRPARAGGRPPDARRIDEALSRLGGTEALIETRFAEMREWQSRRMAENADLLTDLAEQMDFLERVLAQQRGPAQLKPGEARKVTPE